MDKSDDRKTEEISLVTIQEAAERIKAVVRHTPVLHSEEFDSIAGKTIYFKPENLQQTGSFKLRGAYNRLSQLSINEKTRGVVAFSSGNHGKAVALAAQLLGMSAVIVLPKDTAKIKLDGVKNAGAEALLYDPKTDNREHIAKRLAYERNLVLVPPFDDQNIIAGQGTAALELINDIPELDAILVPVGGGGLIAGCSIAAKGLNKSIKVFGVEPEVGNDTYLSIQNKHRVSIPSPDELTIAAGIRNSIPGELPFPIIQKNVDDILLVTDSQIKQAMKVYFNELKLVVEPAGAATAAAVLAGCLPEKVKKIGIIISGGNVDTKVYSQLLSQAKA